jgi:hypothetical protein
MPSSTTPVAAQHGAGVGSQQAGSGAGSQQTGSGAGSQQTGSGSQQTGSGSQQHSGGAGSQHSLDLQNSFFKNPPACAGLAVEPTSNKATPTPPKTFLSITVSKTKGSKLSKLRLILRLSKLRANR